MGHKVIKGKDYYYIHWKGYPAEDNRWEPHENITPEVLGSLYQKLGVCTTRNSQASKHQSLISTLGSIVEHRSRI
jgi:Chromo (CHRromatin Organisation MOdifier) domain